MEHSNAILEDAGKAIDAAASSLPMAENSDTISHPAEDSSDSRRLDKHNNRKRKADFPDARMRYGSRKGKGDGRDNRSGDDRRHKKGDMGRGEYFRDQPDKRQKTNASREKRLEGNGPNYGTQFSQEEIEAEERRPKRKVAVLIGYSGTGYKGMQISASEKTIEGDLFNAFIAAGAISKANADDPKKASLVRCARTDKGVHAAGNMISLKLIVEDDDIVAKINENLSPQIRVWGIERTIGSFSCYQACDSRWYEYLIPSHAFLPPHPSSWLAKKLEEYADHSGDRAAYDSRQEEVEGFWERVDEEEIKPLLATIDEDIRFDVIKALQGEDEANAMAAKGDADVEQTIKAGKSLRDDVDDADEEEGRAEEAAIIINEPVLSEKSLSTKDGDRVGHDDIAPNLPSTASTLAQDNPKAVAEPTTSPQAEAQETNGAQVLSSETERILRLRAAAKQLRMAYNKSKCRYRIPQQRIDRIQMALDKFVGTSNYHNYTIQKTYKDPSAKRHIKSFVVNRKPILIGEGADEEKSEWLSLKVHGQSFMMHQIRKMVGMVTLIVRCGSDLSTLDKSLESAKFSIPKVPGLGLLLERPVFDSYNTHQAVKHDREKLEFSKFEKEIEAFKQSEIYQRIFREEEERNEFGRFFNHIDNFKEPHFLYVTSKGLEATAASERKAGVAEAEPNDDNS